MTANTVILSLGALLLLVGILGGGFEIKEIKVPKVGLGPRVLSAVAGVFFVMLGIGLQGTDASTRKNEPDTNTVVPTPANVPVSAHTSPAEFTIYDQLDGNQVTEQVTVLIDGRVKGQLTVDRQNPQSMLAITVPAAGRYGYHVTSRTVLNQNGYLYEYAGTGQGMINVVDGKRLNVVLSTSTTPWLVTLMDDDDTARAVKDAH